jgi:hypothetical protein
LVEALTDSHYSNAKSCGFFEAQVLWDLDLDVSLGCDILPESPHLRGLPRFLDVVSLGKGGGVGRSTSVAETADSVSFPEGFRDLASYLFDNTAEVTTHLVEAYISSDLSKDISSVVPGRIKGSRQNDKTGRLTLAPLLVKKSTVSTGRSESYQFPISGCLQENSGKIGPWHALEYMRRGRGMDVSEKWGQIIKEPDSPHVRRV